MAIRAYWYRVPTHRNVETPDSFCLAMGRSRKAARTGAEKARFVTKWRDQGWNIALGRRTVESTGDVWWEIWAHATPELKLKPIATIDRVQTIE